MPVIKINPTTYVVIPKELYIIAPLRIALINVLIHIFISFIFDVQIFKVKNTDGEWEKHGKKLYYNIISAIEICVTQAALMVAYYKRNPLYIAVALSVCFVVTGILGIWRKNRYGNRNLLKEIVKLFGSLLLFLVIAVISDNISLYIWGGYDYMDFTFILNEGMRHLANSCLISGVFIYNICHMAVFIVKKGHYLFKLEKSLIIGAATAIEVFAIIDVCSAGDDMKYYMAGLGMASIAVVITSVITYAFNKIERAMVYEEEINAISSRNKLQLEKYAELNSVYENSRKIIHDIRKHLSTIEGILDNEKIRQNYTEDISKKVDMLEYGFYCSNRILQIIMSSKLAECEKKGIKPMINMADDSFRFMEEIDVTAIFANLWDNAIEAVEKENAENRRINVTVGKINSFMLISFENTYTGELVYKDGKIASVKDKSRGYGLKIIGDTIRKYGGQFDTELKDGYFKAEGIIPLD